MADWPYSTARWQRLRKLKLSDEPFCAFCTLRGLHVIADTVDHVVAINRGGAAFPQIGGLRSLCASCHSIKTDALDRAGGSGVAFPGVGVDGLPLDPNHPFLRDPEAAQVQAGGRDTPLEGRGVGERGPARSPHGRLFSRSG
jgi:5-methylcytosine-specific restriction protein A